MAETIKQLSNKSANEIMLVIPIVILLYSANIGTRYYNETFITCQVLNKYNNHLPYQTNERLNNRWENQIIRTSLPPAAKNYKPGHLTDNLKSK